MSWTDAPTKSPRTGRPQAVLLDLDGTILDSVGLILASFRHTFTVHHGAPPPDAAWIEGIGTPLRDQLAGLAREDDDVDVLLETYRTHCVAWHDRLAKPFAGIPEAVRALHARGIRLAVVTSKRRFGAERGVRFCGLEDVLTTLVCPEDTERAKPDPQPVHHALEQLGVEPEDAWFVGDSPHDLKAGRAAGVRTAAATWGPFAREVLAAHTPDAWLTESAQVATLL